eukprot:GFUD01053358.1.p1 GENE.GFUD01053358.1~~GFUD01053358.1.p1  ORF type:complete len:145 (+),score=26.42 GFUD01053358.1:334-768(+)
MFNSCSSSPVNWMVWLVLTFLCTVYSTMPGCLRYQHRISVSFLPPATNFVPSSLKVTWVTPSTSPLRTHNLSPYTLYTVQPQIPIVTPCRVQSPPHTQPDSSLSHSGQVTAAVSAGPGHVNHSRVKKVTAMKGGRRRSCRGASF